MPIHFYTETPSRYGPKSTGKPKKFEIGDYTHVTFSRGAGGPKNHVFAYFEWWSMRHPKNFMLFFTHYGRSSNPENFSVLAHLFVWETGGYPLAEQKPPNFQFLAVPAKGAGPDRKRSGFLMSIMIPNFWDINKKILEKLGLQSVCGIEGRSVNVFYFCTPIR